MRVDDSPAATVRPSGSLNGVRGLSRILDEAIRIPGTNIRVGLDAVLGLIPGGGDLATGLVSGLIMLQAARAGAPGSVLARMLGNVAVDVVIGSIPLIGDVFDVVWRANTKNVRLLDAWQRQPSGTRRASAIAVSGFLVALLLLVGLAVWGAISLGGAVLDWLRTS